MLFFDRLPSSLLAGLLGLLASSFGCEAGSTSGSEGTGVVCSTDEYECSGGCCGLKGCGEIVLACGLADLDNHPVGSPSGTPSCESGISIVEACDGDQTQSVCHCPGDASDDHVDDGVDDTTDGGGADDGLPLECSFEGSFSNPPPPGTCQNFDQGGGPVGRILRQPIGAPSRASSASTIPYKA